MDMSRSWALSEVQELGAKYCRSWSLDDSSRTESLKSYACPGEVTEPLPAAIQRFPPLSTAGAAPPIQIAPWLSPGAASTAKSDGVPPSSATATSHPR